MNLSKNILKEGISEEDLANLLFDRLLTRFPNVITQHGHERVGDAVLDAAGYYAGVEELGTSDIYIMLKSIIDSLEKELNESSSNILKGINEANNSYGNKSAYDRGRADAYYMRFPPRPHKIVDNQYITDLTPEEKKEYLMGYKEGEDDDTKDYGLKIDEDLRKWFKEKWVRFGPDGKIRGACARGDDSEGKPKCLPQAKAHALGKKGRKYAASKKRREDPNPERRGPAKNVATKKKSNEGVVEGAPQPGKSSGKPISWISPEKVITKYLTLNEILNSIQGIPYYNEVVKDRDAKDFTWGVTKKVIEYARELIIRPDAYKNWPPIIVVDGKLQDGAHRISTINLMQKRVQPNNPIWKDAKLKVEFGKSDNVRQGVAEEQLDELKCWPGYTRVKGVPAGAPGSCKKKTNEAESLEDKIKELKDYIRKQERVLGGGNALSTQERKFLAQARKELKQLTSKNKKVMEESCPHCGGEMVSEELMNEKKDACYYKVKSRYKVWPSAYASGALVKCRKKGAKNWGTKSESAIMSGIQSEGNMLSTDKIDISRFKPGSVLSHGMLGSVTVVKIEGTNLIVKDQTGKQIKLSLSSVK